MIRLIHLGLLTVVLGLGVAACDDDPPPPTEGEECWCCNGVALGVVSYTECRTVCAEMCADAGADAGPTDAR